MTPTKRTHRAALTLAALALTATACGTAKHPQATPPSQTPPSATQVAPPKSSSPPSSTSPAPSSGATSPTSPSSSAPGPTYHDGAIAVTVDNAPAARPQTAVDKADLVYEVPAEGGITRYIAFFDSHHPSTIGPVRSTRITFNWIVKGYGVPLAHAGGNVDALNALGPLGIPNLDAIYTAGAAFYRSKARKIPHNLYTSFDRLYKAAKARNMPLPNLPRLPVGSDGSGPPVKSVTIPFFEDAPIYSYTVSWKWKSGTFYRYINGKPDVQTDGIQQHFPNVLIVHAKMVSDASGSPNTTGATRFILKSGRGYAFMNGHVYLTTWTFTHDTFSYKVNGKPLKYAKGPVFVEVVPDSVSVKVQ